MGSVDRMRSLRSASMSAALTLVLIATSCGGSDGETDTAGDVDGGAAASTSEPTVLVIPTSTPLPTPTPLPTTTPVPLEEPTASAVLLTTAFTNSSKVTTVGIGEVFFGMTPEEAAEAVSTAWVGEPSAGSTCYLVTPGNGPDRVTLWIVDGHVERVDVEHPDLRTPSRLGVGNTLAELESQLGGRLTAETGADGSVVATFTPADPGDRAFRIVFELQDDRVVRYSSGRVGVIERPFNSC